METYSAHSIVPRKNIITFVLSILFVSLSAQSIISDITIQPTHGFRCRAEMFGNDTIPVIDLNDVPVYTTYVYKTKYHFEQWTRTKHNVKKVYPYAILAAAKLREYDKALGKMEDPHMKKIFLKSCEKDLRKEFEDEMKEMSVSQGRILMKLIDRESGKTTYEIVEQLRGSFQAVMWNALATLFGNNMKVKYDPVEDIMIERAIRLVETGQI
jgi:hypothetical protein